jgi:hypothetical protein
MILRKRGVSVGFNRHADRLPEAAHVFAHRRARTGFGGSGLYGGTVLVNSRRRTSLRWAGGAGLVGFSVLTSISRSPSIPGMSSMLASEKVAVEFNYPMNRIRTTNGRSSSAPETVCLR